MIENELSFEDTKWVKFKCWVYDCYYKYYASNENKVNSLNKFIIDEIKNFYNLIESIIKEVKVFNKRDELIDELMDELIQKFFNEYLESFVFNWEIPEYKVMHMNILIIGKQGVGKSTLINNFLNINKAKEGRGMGITDNFYSYISEQDNLRFSFRLIDSKGFIDESLAINDINRIKEYIEEKLLSKDYDDYIHCIWYCFSGDRFNSNQINKHITQLCEIYKDDHLPVILVHTKAFDNKDAQETWDILKQSLNNEYKKNYIRVLARNYNDGLNPSFGLDELKKITIEKIKKSVKSSIYQSIRERIIDSYKISIDKKYDSIKENIKKNKEEYINFNYLYYKNIFFEIFNIFYFNNKNMINIEELCFPNDSSNTENKVDEKSNLINNKDNYKQNCKLNDINNINNINDEKYSLITDSYSINHSRILDNNKRNNKNNININNYDGKEKNNLKDKIDNFLKEVNENYKNIYESKIFEIYENIIREKLDTRIIYKLGKKLSETNNTKKKIFNNINEEINKVVQKQDFIQELQDFNKEKEKEKIKSSADILLNSLEAINDDKLGKSFESVTKYLLENENKKENSTVQSKTENYKINYRDIFYIKDIKNKYIHKSIIFFALNNLDYIREKMKNDGFIKNKLNNLIEQKIDFLKKSENFLK